MTEKTPDAASKLARPEEEIPVGMTPWSQLDEEARARASRPAPADGQKIPAPGTPSVAPEPAPRKRPPSPCPPQRPCSLRRPLPPLRRPLPRRWEAPPLPPRRRPKRP